ncbi:c-type cytochrome [Pukyongiella litopenaei]|uniref:Cytochrome c family protein n=1 Tax=Pukyongiella litopenaei TaxID=2605946 RepID=A0A2S0MPH1_9RHOB|nr:cytochrome c family protein [Pukyongiella litopenaei]
MDTMTTTKVAAALCGALLVFLLGKWAAEGIYHTALHGEPSYVIDTGEDEAADEGAEEEVSFIDLLAQADVEKGSKVFKKCSACHKLEKGANGTGPYLYGVVGRPVASADGFGYSDALAGLGGDWTPEHLDEFLTKPSAYAPGTTMSFAGLGKIGDRANLIAFLNTNSDSPVSFEAAEAATDDASEAADAATDAASDAADAATDAADAATDAASDAADAVTDAASDAADAATDAASDAADAATDAASDAADAVTDAASDAADAATDAASDAADAATDAASDAADAATDAASDAADAVTDAASDAADAATDAASDAADAATDAASDAADAATDAASDAVEGSDATTSGN